MLILGLAGGFDPVFDSQFGFAEDFVHDAAAVLVKNGEVVAGIEEERLDRIKHSNKIWSQSVRFCLDHEKVSLDDLDAVAIYASEPFLRDSLKSLCLSKPGLEVPTEPREIYRRFFLREFGVSPHPDKFRFVHHHHAHAFSAYALSGFEKSLVLTIDGAGDDVSTMIFSARGRQLDVLGSKPIGDSLGFFYLELIRFLGYAIFDEYKVMGLAPYGDPARFRPLFQTFYSLLPQGDYTIHAERIRGLFDHLSPRPRGAPFDQIHKDIAAALQDALEEIVFHLLRHYRQVTGHEYLCIAGGVGQNSSMNGKVLSSGLFRDVYVPVAAADSGCALGAALAAACELEPNLPRRRVAHAYWGSDVGDESSVESTLRDWSDFLEFHRMDETARETAQLMAEGKVIGWVQGRSEFGPRALGNRSILADPRRADHKEVINAMIKKREAYRPFAPSVLAERVEDFFVVPGEQKEFPFMTFVLPVRAEMRARLGAITHIDGTARVQTVSRAANPKYWALISEFGRITGVPMLLNTSFNNNAEPIVNSVEDAIVCYLTSGLHYLVVGDFQAQKKAFDAQALLNLAVSLPKAARLLKLDRHTSRQERRTEYTLAWNYAAARQQTLSPEVYEIIHQSSGGETIEAVIRKLGLGRARWKALAEEMFALWSLRLIILRPWKTGRSG